MPIATRPRVYSLYALDDQVRAHAMAHFDLISPGEDGWERWRTEADGLMLRGETISADDVRQIGGKLRFVSKHGVGLDRVDVKALRARGVTIMNTPGVNASAVAELALALALAVARNIAALDRRVRAGETVSKAEGGSGIQLTGRTLGLVGGGNIALALGKMFYGAFGGRVSVYDPYLSAAGKEAWLAAIPATHFDLVRDLPAMLGVSDVVSVHVPLLESTRGLIGSQELAFMKPSAILLNTARGGIVDEEALADALDRGTILGAGLDAFEVEPPTLASASRLIHHPRVISTPHIGAASRDVIVITQRSVVDHMIDAFKGNVRDDVDA